VELAMRLPFVFLTLSTILIAPAIGQETFTFSYDGYRAELPMHPQRVFVLDSRTGLDFAVSAGFPIVATDWDEADKSHLGAKLPAGAARVAFRNEPNAEFVLSQDPDLLVVGEGWWNYWRENAMFDSGALPVLVVKDGSGSDWRQRFADQMAAYGLSDRADRLLAQYDNAVAAAKLKVEAALHGRKVAITDVWGADSVALQVNTFTTSVAADLGITIAVGTGETTDDGYQVYSPENLDAFRDAGLVMSLWTADIAENPLWQRIPAVAAGAQYEMDVANSWGFALTAIDLVHDFETAMAVLGAADAASELAQ
jgi:iron complex transport system substrate-binding protein